jgi:Protein of unknown function with PCYCGC motif
MFKGRRGITVLVAAAVLVVAVAYAAGHVSQDQTAPGVADAADHLRVTLDPRNYVGNVREAYEAAERNPALLSQLHCYCGCDKSLGHKNLLDCFRDAHGSTCAICTGEARDGEQMANRGVAVEQIRDALRARYAHGD